MNITSAPAPWRILVVTHGYPPVQIAGAEQQVQRKVHWWLEHGHTVRVVAADPRLVDDWPFDKFETIAEQVDGVDVHRLRFAVPDASRPLIETYRHPVLAATLETHIETFRPDLIYLVSGILFGLLPLELAAAHGIPSVLFATDFWHSCQRHTLLRPDGTCCPGPRGPADCAACRLTARRPFAMAGVKVQRLSWRALALAGRRFGGVPDVQEFAERRDAVARALQTAGLVICNSQFLTQIMRGLGVEQDRLLTIRQGLDDLSEPAATVARPSMEGDLRILYLGQIARHKGVDLLIDAARRLLDEGVPLTLRIHGPLTDGGFNASPKRAGRIQIGPSLNRDEIVAALGAADVVVVPSRWYENSPNVILEAQAMGLPVVTARHGGMAEMVRHEVDGLLFEPGSATSLVAALRRLALDRELLARLHANVMPPHALAVEMTAEDAAIARLLSAGRDADLTERPIVTRLSGYMVLRESPGAGSRC